MCRGDCVRKRGRKGEREREYMRACLGACVCVCASGRLDETVITCTQVSRCGTTTTGIRAPSVRAFQILSPIEKFSNVI